ncbi:MAG: PHP domain-containing protein [Gemmatimonadota bacterium]|nr:MAG: PHP domain-containing protein [Gemmatimonadota bacterium]
MAKLLFRRWTIRRLLLALVVLYLAGGYVLPRVHWIPADPAIETDVLGVPPLAPAGVRAAGVLGVHTQRSHDAVGSESEVVRAARDAGLDFVILSDHRSADSPQELWRVQTRYEDGVLLVRGQEISLGRDVGRVLVFGIDTVVTRWESSLDELGRLLEAHAATAVVAHSRSPRTRDSWRPRETPEIAGWEVFDLADVGRARLKDPWVVYHLLALAASAPIGRMHESLLRLHRDGFDQAAVAAFDSLYPWNRSTALGALDAHPKTRVAGRLVPDYGPFFKSIVNHIELASPLPRDAGVAMNALAAGLEAGGAFISFGNTQLARNFSLQLVAPGRGAVGMGRAVAWERRQYLRAGFWGGPRDRLIYRVVRDGEHRAWVSGAELAWPLDEPGVYRVEVYRYTVRVGPLTWNLRPWIFANPNWVVRRDE